MLVIVNAEGLLTVISDEVDDIYAYSATIGGTVIDDSDYVPPPYIPTVEELSAIEDQWREEQMIRIANQLLMIEDEDPDAEPGIARQWRDYRIELRKWIEGNADFPDSAKRPVAPQ